MDTRQRIKLKGCRFLYYSWHLHQVFPGALESTIITVNRRVDDHILRHTNEIADLKRNYNTQLQDMKLEIKYKFDTAINDVHFSLKFMHGQVKDWRRNNAPQSERPQPVEEGEERIAAIHQHPRQVEVKIDYLEDQSSHNNLWFDRIPEDSHEDSTTKERRAI